MGGFMCYKSESNFARGFYNSIIMKTEFKRREFHKTVSKRYTVIALNLKSDKLICLTHTWNAKGRHMLQNAEIFTYVVVYIT